MQRRPWLWSIYCITVLLDITSIYIYIYIAHIAGVNNVIADCLSRFQQNRFRQLAPLANPKPDAIPVWPIQSFIDTCSAAILV